MPRYEVTAPDGKKWEVNAPDGASQEEVLAYAQKQFTGQAPSPAGAGAQPLAPLTKADRFARGLRDPLDGGAQLLTKMLPDGVVSAGNRFNNWLADKTGLVAKLPEGGVDQQVREAEAQYQARRAMPTLTSLVTGQKPDPGFDWMRLSGNVLNPANLAVASRIPAAATLMGKVGLGALGGGISSLSQPVTQGDNFAEEKAKQVALGAAFGGATPLAAAGISRLISPKASTDPALALLKQEGVRPTIGQTLGGWVDKVEQKAMSIPFVGDAIAGARERASGELNRAVANRALSPIGEKLPDGKTGRDAVTYVQSKLSEAYDDLLPRMAVQADATFNKEMKSLAGMVKSGALDPKAAASFSRILKNDVLGKFQGQATLTGQTLKQVESDLGQQIARLGQSTDADQRLIGDALKQAQASLRSLAQRTNPDLAPQLKAINAGYANFKRMERAASSVAAEDGVFSPAQLQNAVKALDKSKDKGRFARGDALMQDLADAGRIRLGANVPNSGTADRLAQIGAGAAAFSNPLATGATIGTGLLAYSPWGQAALRGLAASRPQGAQAVAGLLEQGSPMLAPAGGLLALQGLQQ